MLANVLFDHSLLVNVIYSVDEHNLDNPVYEKYPVPEVKILGKRFQNVYTDYRSNIFYNFAQGLIAFHDASGKLWAYDRAY